MVCIVRNFLAEENITQVMEEFDVTDILKQMSEEYPEEYPNDFSEVKMIIEYSNFNEINDIVVPQEVVDNAKEVIGEE